VSTTAAPGPIPPLHGSVTVGVPVEHAFRVFTDSIGTWWPLEYHIGQADMARPVLERLVDGQALRDGLQSGGGWIAMLELFAKAADQG
jgi:hypothetical protein